MKLVEALEVIKTSNNCVTICDGKREIEHQTYFIKWHFKELLQREVKTILTADDKIYVWLKQEEQGE